MEYGTVRLVSAEGKPELEEFVGRLGYYDNDEWDECDCCVIGDEDEEVVCACGYVGQEVAVVYFGKPCEGPYHLVPFPLLEKEDVVNLEVAAWRKENPAAASQLGVFSE